MMTTVLAGLLAVDAILHGLIIQRFGLKGNEPPMIFGLVYAVLTIATGLAVPYVLWAVLGFSLVGNVALTVAFRQIAHERTLERIIWVLNLGIILLSAYLLFGS